jgi:hypothetical protein
MKVQHFSYKVMLPAVLNTDGSYIGMLHEGFKTCFIEGYVV